MKKTTQKGKKSPLLASLRSRPDLTDGCNEPPTSVLRARHWVKEAAEVGALATKCAPACIYSVFTCARSVEYLALRSAAASADMDIAAKSESGQSFWQKISENACFKPRHANTSFNSL